MVDVEIVKDVYSSRMVSEHKSAYRPSTFIQSVPSSDEGQ